MLTFFEGPLTSSKRLQLDNGDLTVPSAIVPFRDPDVSPWQRTPIRNGSLDDA